MTEVTIKEFRAAQVEMESAIRNAAEAALSTFWTKTGLSPNYLRIDLAPVQQLGEREPRYIVEKVVSEVTL